LERKYIFYYTAKGFLIFLVGFLFIFITCIFLVLNFPEFKFVNYSIFALLAFCMIFLSFKVDKVALNNRKNGR